MKQPLNPVNMKRILRFQRDEATGALLYEKIALRQKDQKNRQALLELAEAEKQHAQVWQQYTNKQVAPNRCKVYWYLLLQFIFGFTFAVKLLEKTEAMGIADYRRVEKDIPEVRIIIGDEEKHEARLLELLDEDRLKYVGAMVLGLNDALVELSGTLAGLTFALANTRLVALAGIITGVAATLSMAASNYLAEKANGNANALKSSIYTGVAYIITVVLMVLPYLLLPNNLYIVAFIIMLAVVILIILLFNFYIAVAQSLSFVRKFGEMAIISLSVAFISFLIGLLAKYLLDIDI